MNDKDFIKKTIRLFLVFVFLVLYQNVFTQKQVVCYKPKLHIGYSYKITPIRLEGKNFYFGKRHISTNENLTITGSRIYYEIDFPIISKISFRFAESFRYGMVFIDDNFSGSVINNTYSESKTIKRITTDLSFRVNYSYRLNNSHIVFGLGYSINNLGSSYTYTQYLGNGNYRVTDSNFNYWGPFFSFSYANKEMELGFSLVYIGKDGNNFIYHNEFLIPELKIQFQINRKNK